MGVVRRHRDPAAPRPALVSPARRRPRRAASLRGPLGIERRRCQHKPDRSWVDHDDIDESRRCAAVDRGAVEIARHEVVELISHKRAAALAERTRPAPRAAALAERTRPAPRAAALAERTRPAPRAAARGERSRPAPSYAGATASPTATTPPSSTSP
jgi:hypothetical protein